MAKRNGSGANASWWERWPKLFRAELEAFSIKGITPRTAHKEHGILILEADWPVEGQSEPIHLQIGFSPLHPFFRPAVAARSEDFERHQNPLTKELCLLTQETGQWNSRQLVADFIQQQLANILSTLKARKEGRWDDAAKLEEHAPDPLMPYFAGAAGDDSVILFDGAMPLPREGHGLFEIVYTSRNNLGMLAPFEGVLRQLKNSSGGVIGARFAFPHDRSDACSVVIGRWVKFTPPATEDAAELLRLVEKELQKQAILQAPSVQRINQAATGPLSITGIVFPEEVEYGPQKNGVGWLFLATNKAGVAQTLLGRGERAGKEDIFARLPVARSLLDKKVLVVGCGGIGGFAGLELARAGVGRLTFLDHDVVQPGNSLRWPLGRSAWGSPKAAALARFVAANYPWTKRSAFGVRLGATFSNPASIPHDINQSLLTQLLDLLRGADLVVDTSASIEVQHALSYYCRELKVPYVMGFATMGLAGGIVARFVPDSKSCLVCLHEHWKDKKNLPEPRADDMGIITPVGCNAPTFIGGGFDLQEVSLEVVRSAVGLLSEPNYDPGPWQIAILTLQSEERRRMLPHWEEYECPPHPRCCGANQ